MNNQNISVNPEELKNSANTIRKSLIDLKAAKKLADAAWEDCMSSMSMGEQYLNMLNDSKIENDNVFSSAIDKLEMKANSLDSIANIWKESEIEIMSSYKQFSSSLGVLGRKIFEFKDDIKKE